MGAFIVMAAGLSGEFGYLQMGIGHSDQGFFANEAMGFGLRAVTGGLGEEE